MLNKVLLVSSVHDSIVVDTPSMHVDVVAKTFTEVFNDLQKNVKMLFGYNWLTPLACEVKCGMNMKDMTKIS